MPLCYNNATMKTPIIFAVGLLSPVLLHAGLWANLDEAHHYSGPELSEKTLDGKVVLVENWGADLEESCEIQSRMQQLWTSFKTKPFVIIGSHCTGKAAEKVAAVVAAKNLTFPMYEKAGLADGPAFKTLPYFYVVNHRGRVVYSGGQDREAEEALVTAIADVGQPIYLCRGVPLPKRYKSFSKKMKLGVTITGDLKKLEKEASGKNASQAAEARAILTAIEQAKSGVKEEIAAVKKANPGEALKLMKDFLKTWPKDGEDYKEEIPELQKQADAAKAAAKAAGAK